MWAYRSKAGALPAPPPHGAVGPNAGTLQIRVFVLNACAHGCRARAARPDIRARMSVFRLILQARCKYRTFIALLPTDVVSCGLVTRRKMFHAEHIMFAHASFA